MSAGICASNVVGACKYIMKHLSWLHQVIGNVLEFWIAAGFFHNLKSGAKKCLCIAAVMIMLFFSLMGNPGRYLDLVGAEALEICAAAGCGDVNLM